MIKFVIEIVNMNKDDKDGEIEERTTGGKKQKDNRKEKDKRKDSKKENKNKKIIK